MISAVKKIQFVSHRMSYIILGGRWCDITVLNVHAPTEDKIDDVKGMFYEELKCEFDKFPKYHTKILLGDFKAKVGREDIFKLMIGNYSGVRAVNFATSKNLIVESTIFPNHNINKFTWTSPDGKRDNQIDHILIDRRRHSSILDVRLFRAVDCDTDHLVVAEVKERLAASKRTMQRVHMERFNLKKLYEIEDKEQYHVEISNNFAALENLDTEVDINRVWETIKQNINISATESLGYHLLKKNTSWFEEECSELLDKRREVK
jgi:hypothetical protein